MKTLQKEKNLLEPVLKNNLSAYAEDHEVSNPVVDII